MRGRVSSPSPLAAGRGYPVKEPSSCVLRPLRYTGEMKKTRKPAQAAARGKRTSEGQKPEASNEPSEKRLTWKEERFIWAYIDNGGNASLAAREAGYAPHSARWMGYELLKKPYISEAIEVERERLKNLMNFTREKGIKILLGMVTARASDFDEVLRDPREKENYAGLAEKEYAIEAVKHSYKNGNEVKLISNSERRAALNELWIKLGLDKEDSGADRKSFLERFARLGTKLGRGGDGGGQTGGEGS